MPDFGYIVERNRLPVHYFVSNIYSLKVIANSRTLSTNLEIVCHCAPMKLQGSLNFAFGEKGTEHGHRGIVAWTASLV